MKITGAKNTKLSVMPCRLNGDVHEWFNEVVTVPNWNLPNSSARWRNLGRLVGSEDLVDLYCNLLLWLFERYIE